MWWYFAQLISPKKFFTLSRISLPWLSILFFLLLAYGLIGGLYLAPPDYLQGDTFRILYIHAPSAFLSLFIYGFMTSAAFVLIVWRIKLAYLVIKHSVSLGAIFTALALFTGSLWGKPMWGTWWIWDARLTSELILLFIYLGLLLFISAAAHKNNHERLVAILILVGAIDLPIIHYSVYWWNTLHQGATLRLFSPSTIDASMEYPLLAMIGAFILYYGIVLIMRMQMDLIIQKDAVNIFAKTHSKNNLNAI